MSVWAASLGDGERAPVPRHGRGARGGHRRADRDARTSTGAAGAILLADPFSFPTDAVLRFLSEATPLLPLLGGLASARTARRRRGAVPRRRGRRRAARSACGSTASRCCPCVSQGAAPIGPELTITAAEGHMIGELAGKPALAKLREAIESALRRRPRAGRRRAADRDRRRRQQARLRAGRLPRARAASAPIPTPARSRVGTDVRPGPGRAAARARRRRAPTATCTRR